MYAIFTAVDTTRARPTTRPSKTLRKVWFPRSFRRQASSRARGSKTRRTATAWRCSKRKAKRSRHCRQSARRSWESRWPVTPCTDCTPKP